QHAEAGVHRAVAHAEDPAVAGQQRRLVRFAVPQLEPGLEVVVVRLRAGVVTPDGDTERPLVVAVHAEVLRELAGHALAGEDERGLVGDRLLVRGLRRYADDPAAGIDDRLGDGGL